MISKVTKAIILLIALFILSFIFAIVDSYPNYSSAYDLGYITGAMIKQLVKILGIFGLVVLAFRFFKK